MNSLYTSGISSDQFKVVLVDDDKLTLAVFEECFKFTNHVVVGKALDGKRAVQVFQQTRPDFVFLDIMMPQYDGFYALEKIKQIDPSASVIAVTADLSDDTAKKLRELGVDSIIYKPYDINWILQLMCNIKDRKLLQH